MDVLRRERFLSSTLRTHHAERGGGVWSFGHSGRVDVAGWRGADEAWSAGCGAAVAPGARHGGQCHPSAAQD